MWAFKAATQACAARHDPAAAGRVGRLVEACYASADYQEGRRAFAERRPPVFRGE